MGPCNHYPIISTSLYYYQFVFSHVFHVYIFVGQVVVVGTWTFWFVGTLDRQVASFSLFSPICLSTMPSSHTHLPTHLHSPHTPTYPLYPTCTSPHTTPTYPLPPSPVPPQRFPTPPLPLLPPFVLVWFGTTFQPNTCVGDGRSTSAFLHTHHELLFALPLDRTDGQDSGGGGVTDRQTRQTDRQAWALSSLLWFCPSCLPLPAASVAYQASCACPLACCLSPPLPFYYCLGVLLLYFPTMPAWWHGVLVEQGDSEKN